MLEKPDIPEQVIEQCLQTEYGLVASQVIFLPLGYDVNTAVYRVDTTDGVSHFLKLRKSGFKDFMAELPGRLSRLGVESVIPPLATHSGKLYATLSENVIMLFPYIEGTNGWEIKLEDHHWIQVGAALHKVHSAKLPTELSSSIPKETYDPAWRERVKQFQYLVEDTAFTDLTSQKLAVFIKNRKSEVNRMVQRAEELGERLRVEKPEFVLCHSDAHPGNYLIAKNGNLYLVDWDNPIYATRERDLMFFGAGMSGDQPGGREEQMFYRGYGKVEVNLRALAYYRFERIIQDIAEFCKQLLLSDTGGDDREQAYSFLTSSFEPGREAEAAFRTDEQLLQQR